MTRPLSPSERDVLRDSVGKVMLDERRKAEAVCECGAEYVQVKMSPAFHGLAMEKSASYRAAFSDGWTPDYCPPCSRKWNNATCEDNRVSPDGRFTYPNQTRRPLHSIERPRREIEV